MATASKRSPSATPKRTALTQLDVLVIAIPITLSNATVPLIGFVDAAVIGQLGQTHLLGAVAMAAAIFNFLYFVFNFLRMGTTGLTAQATGADNKSDSPNSRHASAMPSTTSAATSPSSFPIAR